MATKNRFTGSFNDLEAPASPIHQRNEKRGPGRPTGKRSNPAFRQYTVLIRVDTHDRAIEKLRGKTAKPDFGEYVESLIQRDLTNS